MFTRHIAPLTVTVVVAALTSIGACAGPSHDTTTTTTSSPSLRAQTFAGTSLASYRTFSLGQPEGPPSGYETSALYMHQRLEPRVAAALQKRGYTQVPTQGDLIVTFGSGHRRVEVADESNISPGWQAPDEIAVFVDAAMVIDITDRNTNANVWHATANARLESQKDEETKLASFAEQLTTNFPMAAPQIVK